MKKSRLLLSCCFFTATLATARAQREDAVNVHARSVTDELVPLRDIRHIKLGMARAQVLISMRGKPDEIANSDTWIYWNFQGNNKPANIERPAMLVFFTGERVNLIRYSEERLVRQTIAQYRQALPSAALLGQ